MMKRSSLVAILCMAILAGIALPSAAGDYAYALRFDPSPESPSLLVQFDAENNKILKEIEIPDDKGFHSITVDGNKGCFISTYRVSKWHQTNIYYYDNESGKISEFIDLKDIFGPKIMFIHNGELIVRVDGNDETKWKAGIVFIDINSGRITKKLFFKGNPRYSQENINNMYFDGTRYLFLTTFYTSNRGVGLEEMYKIDFTGDVYIIDVVSKEFVSSFEVPREYQTIDGIVNYGDKIYVTALNKGKKSMYVDPPSNSDLLVFSMKTGKLEKTIGISPFARGLTFDKSVNKLYVLHMNDRQERSTIEVIDVTTDQIIKRLRLPSQLMFSVVAPGKIYMTSGPSFLNPTKDKPKLVVLDTKKDEFIKEFEGSYQGISINPKYY